MVLFAVPTMAADEVEVASVFIPAEDLIPGETITIDLGGSEMELTISPSMGRAAMVKGEFKGVNKSDTNVKNYGYLRTVFYYNLAEQQIFSWEEPTNRPNDNYYSRGVAGTYSYGSLNTSRVSKAAMLQDINFYDGGFAVYTRTTITATRGGLTFLAEKYNR